MLPDKDIKLSMTVENGKIPTDMANKVDTVFGELETKYTADLGLTSTMAIHMLSLEMRYAVVLISGALGGLGGLVYITAGVSEWKFENGVAGFGFLALAVMIFGQWKPVNIGLAALLFGLFRALSNVYTGFDLLVALKLPSTVYNMLPYIISLVVLVFVSKKSRAPKAEGIPYDKGAR